MLLFVYTTTHKGFVIFTCRYFKLSWNTTALSQSNCSNFSCSSIKQENSSNKAKYLKFHFAKVESTRNGELRRLSGRFQTLIWRPGEMVQNLESPGLSGRVDSPAMQCTRQQFLTQLASHQFLMVVIVLAFFNRVQKGAPWIRDLTNTLQDSGNLW